MRQMILAALGVFAVSAAASAQQPQYQAAARSSAMPPAAAASVPFPPAPGAIVVTAGAGCSNCGTAGGPVARGFSMSGIAGGNCQYGYACQSGCGSLKSDLAFQFGSCKNFFAPCGPSWNGGPFKSPCATGPMNRPWGVPFGCPRVYDTYANH